MKSDSPPIQSECPPFMRDVTFEKVISLEPEILKKFWQRLNLREIFVRGQLFPYRVEFMSPLQTGPFKDGELNIHHGPFLSAHGAIDGVSDVHRGLQYYYGAYVLSFRLVRLVRLDFFYTSDGVKVRFRAFIAPWVQPLWSFINALFWGVFQRSMK